MLYQVYVVKGEGPDQWQDFTGLYETEQAAHGRVQQAFAEGYRRVYIKQGFDVLVELAADVADSIDAAASS